MSAFAIAIAVSTASAAASERGILDYKVYFGGFPALALEIEIGRTSEEYDISIGLRTLGVIDRLFPWTMRAYSRGRWAGAEVRPEAAGQTSAWRGRRRLVDVRYQDGRPIVARVVPPPDRDGRASVAAADVAGTVDLASAILSLSLAAEAGRGCARLVPVFDGRRRYDLVVEHVGFEPIRRFGQAGPARRALKCRVSMVRRSGFERDPDHGAKDGGRRTALLWLARAGEGLPPVPVRIELETRWGLVIAHLMRVRAAPAGAAPGLASGRP